MTVSIGTAERFDKGRFASERLFVEHVLGLLLIEWKGAGRTGMRLLDAEWIKGKDGSAVFSITTGPDKHPLTAGAVSAFLAERRKLEKAARTATLSLREEEERRLGEKADA